MLCCVVLLSFVGIVFRLRAADDPFPPRARRGVDGAPIDGVAATSTVATTGTASASPGGPAAPQRQPFAAASTAVLRWWAAGVVTYVAFLAVLLRTGAAEPIDDSGLHWFLRDISFAVLAAAALVLAARRPPATRRPPAATPFRGSPALALIGAGAAWTLLGLVDMHVFMLFEIANGRLLPDAFFHTAGVWALVGGVYLLQRPASDSLAESAALKGRRRRAAV